MARQRATRTRRTRGPGATGVQLGEAQARGMILAAAARRFSKAGIREVSVEDLLEASSGLLAERC